MIFTHHLNIISDIIMRLMINIISSMILCMFINYHIYCGFPAVQIRFLAVPDLHALSGAPRPTDTRCATRQLRFLLYVVFLPCPVTARSPH